MQELEELRNQGLLGQHCWQQLFLQRPLTAVYESLKWIG